MNGTPLRNLGIGLLAGLVAGPAAAFVASIAILVYFFAGSTGYTRGTNGLPIVFIFLHITMVFIGPAIGAVAALLNSWLTSPIAVLICVGGIGVAFGFAGGRLIDADGNLPMTYAAMNLLTGIAVVCILRIWKRPAA